MFSRWVDVGKGEIACYEQVLLFPHCFFNDLYYRQVKTRACLVKDELTKKAVYEQSK